jgi:hypothetical protein
MMADLPQLSFLQKCAWGLSAAAIGTIGLEGFLQAPLPAEVGVLIVAYLLAKNSPTVYARLKGMLPAEMMAWLGKAPLEGKRSQLDIWLGREPKRLAEASKREEPELDQRTDEHVPTQAEPVFPRYRDDETLRIGQAIDKKALAFLTAAYQQDPHRPLPHVTGKRFEPHINAFFGKGAVFAAVQGSGKSMLNGRIIEQAGECDAPVIVLDHKGEYPPIVELSHLNGLLAGGKSACSKAERLGVPSFALTTRNADAFVEKVITGHHQAIVSLPSYGDSWLERASIVAEVGQALMRYSGRMRQEEKKVLPCLVFLDEAQLYLPQNVNLLPPEARENKDVLDNLSNAYFALVSNGRSNGYTMCFATQSLTYIAKWAIKSSQIRVIMRHVEVNDLDMCERMIADAVASREEIESLPAGVGVVFGFTPKPMVVQFDRRESRDDSETPGIERLREVESVRAEASPKRLVAEMSLDELVALLNQRVRPGEQMPEDEPHTDALPEERSPGEAEPSPREKVTPIPIVQDKGPRAEDIDLSAAITLWNNGYNSDRELAKAFHITKYQGNRLAGMIREQIKKQAADGTPD